MAWGATGRGRASSRNLQEGAVYRRARQRAAIFRDHQPIVIRHLLAPVLPAAAASLRVPRTVQPGRGGVVALTFDDGPHPAGTPAVLDVLSRAGARATFFVI